MTLNFRERGNSWDSLASPLTSPAPQDTPACPFCIAEKYSPVFVNDVNYITWRTGPYNSVAWNKHSSYLPPLPKVDPSPLDPPQTGAA